MSGISGVQQHHQTSRIKCVLSVYRLNTSTEHRQQRTGVLRGADIKVINRRKQDERAAVTPQNKFSAEWKRFSLLTSLQTLLFIIPLTQSTTAINLQQWCKLFLYAPIGHMSLLIDKGGNRLRSWNFEKKKKKKSETHSRRHSEASGLIPLQHTWQKRETVVIFQFLMRLFLRVVPRCSEWITTTWAKHFSRNSRFLFARDPSRECINHHSLFPLPPPKWRQREQQLGERSSALNSTGCRRFSHHFLLWILTSIVMNTLERCLTAWAQIAIAQQPRRWRWILFARLCVLLTMSLGRRVTMWCTRLCVPVRPRALLSVSVPLCWGQIWVICRIAGSPKMTWADRNN